MSKTTTKVKCTCKHEEQDKMYGPQVRIANLTTKGDQASKDVRCTVCSKIHRVPNSALN